jgi:hypothetical protein
LLVGIQTGKFVLRSRDLGCAISDSGRANFGNVPKNRALSKATAFIRASEKLLCNISSPSAHLESEESVSARAALKKRERKKMRTGKREKQGRMRNLRETEFEMRDSTKLSAMQTMKNIILRS